VESDAEPLPDDLRERLMRARVGPAYLARGSAFQRVEPPRKAAAVKIACPTRIGNTAQVFSRRQHYDISEAHQEQKSARHLTKDAWRVRYQRLTTTLRFRFRIFHAQVILHRAEAESGRGRPHVSDFLFQLAIHYAFQCHMAVLHDNVNRRDRLNTVA
jgi:hypothetical protein